MPTICEHRDIIQIHGGMTLVSWCPACGSIKDNNGDHCAKAGEWRSPNKTSAEQTTAVVPARASFHVMVPNDDEGQDLGEYKADYLPREGDLFFLWHPKVCGRSGTPFEGKVVQVAHEAFHESHKVAGGGNVPNQVVTTVWLTEENAPPVIYCDCSPEKLEKWKADENGRCKNCGHLRDDE
jgi:hypothetical protein